MDLRRISCFLPLLGNFLTTVSGFNYRKFVVISSFCTNTFSKGNSVCWLKKKKRRSAVKHGYLTQQRNKTPPSFSSQPLHGNFITHQSQARFAHLVLLPSAFQPAEVLLETPTMLSLVEVAFSTQGLCRLCFGWNVPFYWNGGGEGQRERHAGRKKG